MDWLRLLWTVAARRARGSKSLLALVAVITFSTVTLVSVTAIYLDALGEAGLRHTIASVDRQSTPIRVIVQDRPSGRADYQRLRNAVEGSVERRVGWLEAEHQRYGRTVAVPLGEYKGDKVQTTGDLTFLFFKTDFEKKVRLVDGQWPQLLPQAAGEPLVIEVLVGATLAPKLGWQVGSTVAILPYGAGSSARVKVRIAGTMEPIDGGDMYWLGDLSHFEWMSEGSQAVVPLFTTEEVYLDSFGAVFPTVMGTYWWFSFLDTDKVTSPLVERAKRDLGTLETDINKALPRSYVLTGLDSTLVSYEQRLTMSRVPLLLFISLVVGLLLYFLALVMNMLVQSRSREMAMVRGRGAGIVQVIALTTFGEGIGLVVLSVGVGPLVAWVIVREFLIGSLNPLGVADVSALVHMSGGAYLLALGAGLMALGVLLLATLFSARLHLADFLKERARPPRVSLVHRYYLDFLVVAILGVVLWQVRARGGFVTEHLLGGVKIDPSLLFGPAIALLAAGLMLMRVLPFLLRVLAAVAERARSAWLAFSMKRMSKDPMIYGLLANILLAACALGVFASVFQPTLLKSQYDQTYFSVASDIIAREPMSRSGKVETIENIREVNGVLAVTGAHRVTTKIAVEGVEPEVTVLALTSSSLAETVWFRDDFADKGLGALVASLQDQGSKGGGEVWLPAGAEVFGVWCRLQEFTSVFVWRPNLWARLMDPDGNYQEVFVGELPFKFGWQYLEARLPEMNDVTKPPFRLVTLYMSMSNINNRSTGVLLLDDIVAKGKDVPGGEVVVEGFESERGWRMLPRRDEEKSGVVIVPGTDRAGSVLRLSWREYTETAPLGIVVSPTLPALAAIGGPGFSPGEDVYVYLSGSMVKLNVRDTVRYFPMLEPDESRFLLVDLEEGNRYVNELPLGHGMGPNEYWITRDDAVPSAEIVASLRGSLAPGVTILDREVELDMTVRDPLKPGGWGDVTLLAVVVLCGVTLLGLLSYGVLYFERACIDMAVVRTLGFSRLQIMAGIVLERVVVVVVGVLGGWGVGLGLSRWVLSYFDVTATGEPVVPPMLLDQDGGLLVWVYGGVAVATLLALLAGVAQAMALRIAMLLRVEE
jgi:hypothetical protein